ncbi:hypothetical protein [Nocardia sp. NPDC060249]|uniref:hypothetical protein n=1 Tax=Nocardia sp. NPDC060249 TaxID=3347082 RepID=UPI003648C1F5
MTPIDKGVIELFCISHGCEIWRGRYLSNDEARALSVAHALQHHNRPITPADLFGDTTGENE